MFRILPNIFYKNVRPTSGSRNGKIGVERIFPSVRRPYCDRSSVVVLWSSVSEVTVGTLMGDVRRDLKDGRMFPSPDRGVTRPVRYIGLMVI